MTKTNKFTQLSAKRSALSQLSPATLALCSFAAMNSYADQSLVNKDSDQIEHIIVTADKRSADLMSIGSSITALTAEVIEDSTIESITDLSQHVANLHIFSWGGRRDSNVFIRGIGPGLFTDPTVGFYVDGVNYSSNGMFDMDLMDVERVEVLRGPQGTLYGGNSLSGVINVVTKEPSDTLTGKTKLTIDDLNRQKLAASISIPLNQDTLSLGLAFSGLQADGYRKNIYNNTDFGQRDDITGRAKLMWQASMNLDVVFAFDFEKFEGDSYAMGPTSLIKDNPKQVNHDFAGVDDRDSLGSALTINWQGDSFDITSISSWRDWQGVNSADQDGASMAGFSYSSFSEEAHEQLSQEIRFLSKANSSWQWIAGLYAYHSEFDVESVNIADFSALGMGGPYADYSSSQKENQGYALFGQIDFNLSEHLTMTTGLRLDHEEREATVTIDAQTSGTVDRLSGSKDFDEILPKLLLSYQTNETGLVYGSVSKGYRAGGFDTLYPNLENPTYDSESSVNYEMGYKNRLLENQLSVTTALFMINIDDQQVQQLLPSGTIITDNAAKSSSRGVEFESVYRPNEGWIISLSASYTDAKFDDYIGINLMTFGAEDYSDNRLPNASKINANLSIQNRQQIGNGLTWFSQVDNQYIGEYYFDATNQLEQEAYNLLNAKFGIEADSWSAYVWVKNALDEYYSKVEFDFGFGPTAEAGEPRSMGVTFNASF